MRGAHLEMLIFGAAGWHIRQNWGEEILVNAIIGS